MSSSHKSASHADSIQNKDIIGKRIQHQSQHNSIPNQKHSREPNNYPPDQNFCPPYPTKNHSSQAYHPQLPPGATYLQQRNPSQNFADHRFSGDNPDNSYQQYPSQSFGENTPVYPDYNFGVSPGQPTFEDTHQIPYSSYDNHHYPSQSQVEEAQPLTRQEHQPNTSKSFQQPQLSQMRTNDAPGIRKKSKVVSSSQNNATSSTTPNRDHQQPKVGSAFQKYSGAEESSGGVNVKADLVRPNSEIQTKQESSWSLSHSKPGLPSTLSAAPLLSSTSSSPYPFASRERIESFKICSRLSQTRVAPHLLNIEFQTENINRVTYFVMSCLVATFINPFCGVAAIFLSVKSHKLFILRTVASRKKARFYGKLAFFVNVIGILTTMISLIFVFYYLGESNEDDLDTLEDVHVLGEDDMTTFSPLGLRPTNLPRYSRKTVKPR